MTNQNNDLTVSPQQEEAGQENITYFISTELKPCLLEGIEHLFLLKKEIEQKKDLLSRLSTQVIEKARSLIPEKNFAVNEGDLDQSHKSISEYLDLLEKIHQEILIEIAYFLELFQNDDTTPHQEAPLGLILKIKGIKKYTKQIRKDLLVSFSRYQFGFTAQAKRLDYIERVVSRVRK